MAFRGDPSAELLSVLGTTIAPRARGDLDRTRSVAKPRAWRDFERQVT